MTFLDKLDAEMATMGINKRKLSQISGVPYTTIDGFYKKGYENAKISTIRKISKALGVSLDYLVEEDIEHRTKKSPSADESVLGEDERNFLNGLRSLTQEQQEVVLALVRTVAERNQKRVTSAPVSVPDTEPVTPSPTQT
mgnify:CR=1 FL=1